MQQSYVYVQISSCSCCCLQIEGYTQKKIAVGLIITMGVNINYCIILYADSPNWDKQQCMSTDVHVCARNHILSIVTTSLIFIFLQDKLMKIFPPCSFLPSVVYSVLLAHLYTFTVYSCTQHTTLLAHACVVSYNDTHSISPHNLSSTLSIVMACI